MKYDVFRHHCHEILALLRDHILVANGVVLQYTVTQAILYSATTVQNADYPLRDSSNRCKEFKEDPLQCI